MMKTWPCRFALSILCLSLGAGGSLVAQVCDGVSQTNNTNLVALTIASGLATEPILVTSPPGDTDRIFIVGKNGVILVKHRGNPATTVFLNISAKVLWSAGFGETGLLGMAFDPDYATNGFFYVNYTRLSDTDSIVARYQRNAVNPDVADAGEKLLVRMDDAESNHNGGHLAFGPDGYLYIATGDGGGGGDLHGACGNGQNKQSLLGKLLRIDPGGAGGTSPDCGLDANFHVVPSGNPLADGPGGDCDEIWAYGLRNPWRFSFDPANGDLYIGDVGQNCWEEIDYVPGSSTGGENYGWRQFEGRHCFDTGEPGCVDVDTASCCVALDCSPACSDPLPSGDPVPNGTVLPVFDYTNTDANCTVIGGDVYRGCRMNSFQGKYFYADICVSLVRSLVMSGGVATNHQNWMDPGNNVITSFGTDGQGEIYIALLDGRVLMLAPPLPDLEVSGTGAEQFMLSPSGDWTWENLSFTSNHPLTGYHIYRADILDGRFNLGEVFNCIFTTTGTTWPSGGDTATPAEDQFNAYIVLAKNSGGQLTNPGGSPPRTLGTACP